MVVWITGLSGSGKTTVCEALSQSLKPILPQIVMLDGDVIRSAFGGDLGYQENDRVTQIKRLQRLAKTLSDQGMLVIVAALYCNNSLMDWNRHNLKDYFEIYLEASLDYLKKRDYKCLYAKAISGEMINVVGVDINWQPPENPDLVINTNDLIEPAQLARQVIAAIPRFKEALRGS